MRLAGDCSSPAITGSALEVQAVYRENKIPWCTGQVACCYTMIAVKSLNRMSQVWDNSTVTAVQCVELPSMADGQGRARSGSIPDVPLRRKAEKKKQRHLVSDMLAGCFCVRFDIEGGKTCL